MDELGFVDGATVDGMMVMAFGGGDGVEVL